ncbi:elongation of very long chain fatty acids protein-like protein [Dinothrombium tinctorium]|uniref:Elongation of very long chain fatty acids protein n=1 Tax=Dinothrombium tinctorium TaxID=1965070 RepID=A0A3S3PEG3_9ACAR|nr:elongation of very long chain fatty acids protein-like protein [Dinothrombium tinctorium]
MESVKNIYSEILEVNNPRLENLPLVNGGPWKVCVIVASYLIIVKILGPQFMKGRQPFDLRKYMLLYNCFLIGFNGIGFFIGLWMLEFGRLAIDCTLDLHHFDHIQLTLFTFFGWLYFISKVADFMDTFFFVLRKKANQVTFLHVFHHSVMPLIGYAGMKFHPLPYSGLMPLLNVFVHAVMYSYYALSSAGPEMKKYLFWKKRITQIQMIQFVMTLIHSVNGLINPNCKWPKFLAFCECIHSIIFLILFYSFYRKSYSSEKVKSQ